MRILELNIIEFGGLKDRVIALSEGLNLLEGENETGKSTVWLFIKFMLYGLPRKGQEERVRSVSRLGHSAKGSMRVLFEGEEYVIERVFVESARSGSEKKSVFRVSSGETVFEGVEPGEGFFGVPKEVFESSCGIGQNRGDGSLGKKSLDAIRNLLSSADESTDIGKIEEKLDKIRVTYRHKTGKGGRLVELGERLAAEKTALGRAEECHGRIAALEEKLRRNQAKEEEADGRLKELRELLTAIGKRDLLRRFDGLRESERQLRALSEEAVSLCRSSLRGEAMPTEGEAARLLALAEQWEAAEERTQVLEAAKARLRAERSYEDEAAKIGRTLAESGGLEAWQKNWNRIRRGARSAYLTGALLLALGGGLCGVSLALSLGLPMTLVGAGVALGGLAALIVGVGKSKKHRRMSLSWGTGEKDVIAYLTECDRAFREKQKHGEALLRAESDLSGARRMADELGKKIGALLEDSRLTRMGNLAISAESARREAARITAFLSAFGEYERKMQVLREGMARDRALLDAYDEQALRSEVSERVLAMKDEEVRRAETEQRFYSTQIESLRTVNRRDQVELISLRANFEEPTKIADRISALEGEYGRASEYSEALTMALEGIRNAAKTMSGSVTPLLSREAGSMMAYFSEGRYSALHTGNDLSPSLVGEDGLRVDPELLSGGTKDAAYLALRIALLTQVFRGDAPPLMMDEAFCQMDDRRLGRVLSLLGRLTAERGLQCLVFTCHTRESETCRALGIPHTRILL